MSNISPFHSYVQVKVGEIPKAKMERALKGMNVRFTNADLSGDRVLIVHPQNAKAIKKAQAQKKGLMTTFTPFEALADLEHYDKVGAGLEGGSLWSWLKNKAYPWLKTNWNTIKPVVSKIADVAIPAAAAALGAPQAGTAVREGVKALTGVGMKRPKKGTPEAKEYMRQLRERRGGSFRVA